MYASKIFTPWKYVPRGNVRQWNFYPVEIKKGVVEMLTPIRQYSNQLKHYSLTS